MKIYLEGTLLDTYLARQEIISKESIGNGEEEGGRKDGEGYPGIGRSQIWGVQKQFRVDYFWDKTFIRGSTNTINKQAGVVDSEEC